MKIIIYYFSGTGNTWWITNTLQQQLSLKKHEVEWYSIESIGIEEVTKQIHTADHIILGFPVYGSTAPRPMLDFINLFPATDNKQAISIFATHALASGDSAYQIGLMFLRKGYVLKQTKHFVMMNNFHIPKFRFYKPKNDHRLDQLLEKTNPKVERFAEEISNEQEHIIGKNWVGHLLGSLQRRHIDRVIQVVSKELKVEPSRCIQCGKCQRICPSKNIEMTEGAVQLGNQCVLCLRCYSQCPTAAILLGEGTKDESKYPRYKGPGKEFDINRVIKGR